jgi:hypothetical protein
MQESAASGDTLGLAGATLADRYQVDHQVGEGGYAVVYYARQVSLDRPVALKILKTPPGLDASARSRFRGRFAAEAKTIALLKHPSVVDVYDFGISQLASGELAPWMALEWLEGETLEANLERRRGAGGRPVPAAVALLRPVIEALADAHRRGVIHRDIKPANLMVVATDEGPRLRMLDFGIAKIVRAGQLGDTGPTGSSGAAGFSPEYAAPEQVTYSRTGPFTDVHALGLLLTELLTDEPPFSDGEEAHVFEQVMSAATRPTPRAKGKDVGELETVIAKAVALSPSRRFENAGELLRALDAVVPPRPAADRGGKTVKVRRRLHARALAWTPWSAPSVAPPPAAPRVRDPAAAAREELAMTGLGVAALIGALALLAWTFATGLDRPTPWPSEQLAAARRASQATGHLRLGAAGLPSPWIVPFDAPPPALAEPPTSVEPAPRRGKPPRAAAATEAAIEALVLAPAAAGSCAVTINSVPWSEVVIDGRSTGVHTPLVDYAVPCGHHEIVFRRPELRIKQSESIDVRPGETFRRRFSLATDGG